MNLKGRNKISPEFNMSSMTDIVFLLLIFFMIASTLAKNLDTIEIKLPEAKGKTENRNTVSVTINNRSQFFIDSKQVSKRRIERELLSKLKSSSSPSIVLRAEKKVAIDQVVYIMNIANQNSIKVVLAVDSQ
ncbi:biopolymer transporter ExbD [Flavobacteriaceae bacterium]|jgi:biopolymer transport protein ExbD|nr:biopolymer transporter ExbD [Flavobacteriaceae bacterium]MDA9035451.1 biopolymer transporter ExbD [Flavobacteriaceae bacterium]|tara:strand:+ start:1068 stop:1463 length:396 start_codon:yes stop_codon:yes gene_type:complete